MLPVGKIERVIDNLSPDVRYVEVRLSRSHWPLTSRDTVAFVSLTWSDGSRLQADIPGGIIDSDHSALSFSVPRVAGRRKDITSVKLVLDVLEPLQTDLVFEVH